MTWFSTILDALDEVERAHLRSLTQPRMAFEVNSAREMEPGLNDDAEAVGRVVEAYSLSLCERGVDHAMVQGHVKAGDNAKTGAALASAETTGAQVLELIKKLDTARLSLLELRSLRRQIAWLCHPDRRTDAHFIRLSTMAEANARIDEAITKLENSSRRPKHCRPE